MNKPLLALGSALVLVARVLAAEAWGTDIAAAKAFVRMRLAADGEAAPP